MSTSCIFCRIVAKEIPAPIILENEHVLVIPDKTPRAPVHLLLIPKHHIENFCTLTPEFVPLVGQIGLVARQLSGTHGNKQDGGFNLIINNQASAGQSVFHMHWHFLSGKNIYENGFAL